MNKRKCHFYNLRSNTVRRRQIFCLENISCLSKLFEFLTFAETAALWRCTKAYQNICLQTVIKKRIWNLRTLHVDIRNIANLNLNWIEIGFFEPENTDEEISNLMLAPNITKLNIQKLNFPTFKKQYVFPETLTHLDIRCFSTFPCISALPSMLKHLRIRDLNKTFPRLILFPTSLTALTFGCQQNIRVGILPESLVFLNILFCTNQTLVVGVVPPNVQSLQISFSVVCELYKDCLPQSNLRRLCLDGKSASSFHDDFVLPMSLIKLSITKGFDQGCNGELPKRLRVLEYFGSESFFSKFTSRTLPSTLKKLIVNNKKSTTSFCFPADMLSSLSNLKVVNMGSSNIADITGFATALQKNTTLIHLRLVAIPECLTFEHMLKLQTLYISLEHGQFLLGLEKLPLLHTLVIEKEYEHDILLPMSLESLTLDVSYQNLHFQNLYYLTNLTYLKIQHTGRCLQISAKQFPSSLLSLQLCVSILKIPVNTVFPPNLHALNLTCDVHQPQFCIFPEKLRVLAILETFSLGYLFLTLPKKLEYLSVPRSMLAAARAKFPGLQIESYVMRSMFEPNSTNR